MLYIIEGTDLAKKQKVLASIQSKHSPDYVERYDEFSPEVLNLADSNDLFDQKTMIIVYSTKTEDFLLHISRLENSSTIFILSVDKLLASDKKKLGNTKIFDCLSVSKKSEFNIFAITDAFASKNKKDLWVLYQKALRQGVEIPQIQGILLWQIKSLLIVAKSNEKESGMKSFTYNKSKRALANFTESELVRYQKNLVFLYHNSRKSDGESLQTAFERFLISL